MMITHQVISRIFGENCIMWLRRTKVTTDTDIKAFLKLQKTFLRYLFANITYIQYSLFCCDHGLLTVAQGILNLMEAAIIICFFKHGGSQKFRISLGKC